MSNIAVLSGFIFYLNFTQSDMSAKINLDILCEMKTSLTKSSLTKKEDKIMFLRFHLLLTVAASLAIFALNSCSFRDKGLDKDFEAELSKVVDTTDIESGEGDDGSDEAGASFAEEEDDLDEDLDGEETSIAEEEDDWDEDLDGEEVSIAEEEDDLNEDLDGEEVSIAEEEDDLDEDLDGEEVSIAEEEDDWDESPDEEETSIAEGSEQVDEGVLEAAEEAADLASGDADDGDEEGFGEGELDEYEVTENKLDEREVDSEEELAQEEMDSEEEGRFSEATSEGEAKRSLASAIEVSGTSMQKTWVPVKKVYQAPFRKNGILANGVYLVRPGDSINSVSTKIYGTSDREQELLRVNPTLMRGPKVGDKVYYNSPQRPNDQNQILVYYEDFNIPSKAYTSQEKDNIRAVSMKLLGDKDSWKEIWATNPHVESKGQISAGIELKYWPNGISAPSVASSKPLESLAPPTKTNLVQETSPPPLPDPQASLPQEDLGNGGLPAPAPGDSAHLGEATPLPPPSLPESASQFVPQGGQPAEPPAGQPANLPQRGSGGDPSLQASQPQGLSSDALPTPGPGDSAGFGGTTPPPADLGEATPPPPSDLGEATPPPPADLGEAVPPPPSLPESQAQVPPPAGPGSAAFLSGGEGKKSRPAAPASSEQMPGDNGKVTSKDTDKIKAEGKKDDLMTLVAGGLLLIAAVILVIILKKRAGRKSLDFNTMALDDSTIAIDQNTAIVAPQKQKKVSKPAI